MWDQVKNKVVVREFKVRTVQKSTTHTALPRPCFSTRRGRGSAVSGRLGTRWLGCPAALRPAREKPQEDEGDEGPRATPGPSNPARSWGLSTRAPPRPVSGLPPRGCPESMKSAGRKQPHGEEAPKQMRGGPVTEQRGALSPQQEGREPPRLHPWGSGQASGGRAARPTSPQTPDASPPAQQRHGLLPSSAKPGPSFLESVLVSGPEDTGSR